VLVGALALSACATSATQAERFGLRRVVVNDQPYFCRAKDLADPNLPSKAREICMTPPQWNTWLLRYNANALPNLGMPVSNLGQWSQ
jgi:hypothetical protein